MRLNKARVEEGERIMSVLDKANEIIGQIAGFATVSLSDVIGSVFMRLVLFFVEFLLG